jgi:tetratricopeptide (TPR) repeat protein
MAKPQYGTHGSKGKASPPPAAAPRPIPRWVVWATDHGLWITLAAGISARVIHWASIYHYDPLYAHTLPMSDMQTYWQWAKEIAAGDWLGAKSRPGPFYYGPLYAYFLGVLFRGFGESYNAVHAVQALLGLLSPVVLWAICRRLFGKGPALATGLMAALCAPILFYEQQILVEGLLIAVNALLLLCLVRGQEPGRWTWLWAFGSGALSAISCWGRGSFLLVIPALAVAWLIMPTLVTEPPPEPEANRNSPCAIGNPKSRIQNPKLAGVLCATAYVLGVALLLGVTLWRNHHVAGQWVITTSNGPILTYLGNASDAHGAFYYPPSYKTLTERYGSQNAVPWGRELLCDMAAHPLGFARVMARKIWMFWNSYDIADNVSYYLYKRYLWPIRWNPVNWLTLLPLALLGLWETRGLWRHQVFLYIYALGFACSIIAILVVGRYRLPLMLPMLIWAGPATVGLICNAWESRWKNVGIRAAVLTAGVALLWPTWSPGARANSPPTSDRVRLVRPNDYDKIAEAFQNLGRRQEARQLVEEAVSDYPWVKYLVVSLAKSYIRDGQSEKAVAVLETYLQTRGTEERDGVVLLAIALVNCRRQGEAIERLQRLLQSDPNDSSARALLARIQGGK